MATDNRELPIGVKLIHCIVRKLYPGRVFDSQFWYRLSVLLLTFLSYTSYHAAKKPLSVVKNYFQRNCDNLIPPPDVIIDNTTIHNWCDWAPFDQSNGGALLGTLDSAFLFAYAGAMFVSGAVAERVSLRYFLAVGMITSGISCYLFGIARYLNIHRLSYFIFVQIFAGFVQSSGWPGVVAVIGRWFGKNKRGLIFGIWNSHTSVGNILGTFVAGAFLSMDWGLSFIVPGMIIALLGFVNFIFLVESPGSVEYLQQNDVEHSVQAQQEQDVSDEESANSDTELLNNQTSRKTYSNSREAKASEESPNNDREETAVSMLQALRIPGVKEFSACLFFAKLVCYTFLFWLPVYIKSTTTYSDTLSAYISTIFDFGGVLGGIIAGAVSDHTGRSAVTCTSMLVLSAPMLIIYHILGDVNPILNGVMLAVVGFLTNGPYALITTAVSAELGTHPSISQNSKALATVSAIIDGTGSLGAAVGPLVTGLIYGYGWGYVFCMLIVSNMVATICLFGLARTELQTSRLSD